MEVLLNAIWLLVSAAVLGGWAVARSGREPLKFGRGFFVLGCALVLLFPVISMTDDFHAQEIALENPSPSSKKLQSFAYLDSSVQQDHSLAALLLLPALRSTLALWAFVTAVTDCHPAAVVFAHSSERAPPFRLS